MVYFIKFPDSSKAWLSFKVEDGKLYLIETYTPPQHRGKGYARKLVEAAVKDARKEGLKIVPICSYAVHYFIKNVGDREVLAEPYASMSDEELRKYFEERLQEERSKHS
ncbi:MAG: N-acetyltransferase [Desulfurococcales archaeon]|nr:N-acetyltransferase [Desulfurococcales archaeon]